jgi:hypothetical protein
MNPPEPLPELLEEWRSLTLAEGAALRARDWSRANECQSAKQELQPQLARALAGVEPTGLESARPMITEIIALATANNEWLTGQKAVLKAHQLQLDENSRNLRRVRQSYSAPSPARWQSYS